MSLQHAAEAAISTSCCLLVTVAVAVALVALLYMWFHTQLRRGSFRKTDARARACSLLEAFAIGSCTQPSAISIVVDDPWECMWPRPEQCGTRVEFPVLAGGIVDLKPRVAQLHGAYARQEYRRVLFREHPGFCHCRKDAKIKIQALAFRGPAHACGVMISMWLQIMHALARRL